MDRLKEVIQEHSRWEDLEIYPQRIETFLDSDFMVAIENGKALLETICKTILDEQKQTYTNNDNVNKLTRNTLLALGLVGDKQIAGFGNGLISALQNLGELRNRIGDASHGRSLVDKRNNKLELLSAYFLVNAVEIIACFLIEYYELEFPRKTEQEEATYDDFRPFNDYFDDLHGTVPVADYDFLASEILFTLDSTAYDSEYQQYLEQSDETD
ncbi:MAG: abortive infection family protein [Chloroflexota bacterium]